ncbi:hypothetical protein [Fretibacter rubidus]|uniref:hypothetical protein n=1 Tax=Fretibacter rubidus TaxID=570162 RepID=UPI00352AA14E
MFNPLKTTVKLSIPRVSGPVDKWRIVITAIMKTDVTRHEFFKNGTLMHTVDMPIDLKDAFAVVKASLNHEGRRLDFEVGALSLMKMGAVVYENGEVVARSSNKPFYDGGKTSALFAKIDDVIESTPEQDAEAREKLERSKALYPAIGVDIAMAILFFFVAREFGLITAALAGAGVTIALTVIDRFVKPDLLGGFAAFGVVMALISASLAYFFQDDLFIKLRGSIMGCIGVCFALADAYILKGDYLGKRMARYMEGLFAIKQRAASLAMAVSSALIIMVDTPLAFMLTTDQWIWYNSFLDGFIAMPIFFGVMYLARDKSNV